MIQTIIFAALMLTSGGLVLWFAHWIRRNVELQLRSDKQ